MARGHWPCVAQILDKMDLQPGQACLDVGCGSGYAVRAMAEAVGSSGRADGVDASSGMISRAQVDPGQSNIRFQVAPAEQLPFIDAMFDRLLSVEALYYMTQPLAALREWYRVLKPGGSVWVMMDYYRENPASAVWGELLGVPTHFLSESEYQGLFRQAGFAEVRTERLMDPTPVDVESFRPGWGYETPDDVRRFREEIGSLLVVGVKPIE